MLLSQYFQLRRCLEYYQQWQFQTEGNEKVIFEPGELKFFVAEVKEMISNNEIIDLPKAIHNAKYFSMLEKRIANVEAGHYVEHDLIEDDDDE